MKPLHLPLEGHDLLAVERFKDDTRHMAEFLILSTHCPLGRRGQYKRLFLTEDEYARMRSLERQGQLQIRRHAAIIEGHILHRRMRSYEIFHRQPSGAHDDAGPPPGAGA